MPSPLSAIRREQGLIRVDWRRTTFRSPRPPMRSRKPRRRLKLQQPKELASWSRPTTLVFRLAREERDAWVNWPARAAALMAAELGLEASKMQKVLEAHVRAHIDELAEVRLDLR